MRSMNVRRFGKLPSLTIATALLLVSLGAALGQSAPDRPTSGQEAKDRAIVEQFWPRQLLNDDAADVAEHGPPSTARFVFVAADLNGTGRKEFLVALYVWAGGGAMRVLKKQGDTAVVVDEPKLCPFIGGGVFLPEVSAMDLDKSGRPAILAGNTDNYGRPQPWIFKWDGTGLKSLGAQTPVRGLPCTDLVDPLFVDLDGDGVFEIVNGFESERPDQTGPARTRVYKLENGVYKQTGIFEYFFYGIGAGGEDTFLARHPEAPYVVTVANGSGKDEPPVGAAEIRLNGQLIAGADKINRKSRYLSIPVTVKDQNSVEVKILSGSNESRLYVGVGPVPSGSH